MSDFLWAVSSKLQKYVGHIFGLFFSSEKSYALCMYDKNGLGCSLGDFLQTHREVVTLHLMPRSKCKTKLGSSTQRLTIPPIRTSAAGSMPEQT
jgi:hypothetical protein